MARHPQTIFNALIRRCIDLRALYRDAAGQAAEPGLRVVLEENAAALDAIIADLQGQVAAGGGRPALRGRAGSAARRHVVEWLLPHSPARDAAWIHHLAHAEGMLLHTFEQGLRRAPPDAVAALVRQRPRLESIHMDMHSLARAR